MEESHISATFYKDQWTIYKDHEDSDFEDVPPPTSCHIPSLAFIGNVTPVYFSHASALMEIVVPHDTTHSKNTALRALSRYLFHMRGEDVDKRESGQLISKAKVIMFPAVPLGH